MSLYPNLSDILETNSSEDNKNYSKRGIITIVEAHYDDFSKLIETNNNLLRLCVRGKHNYLMIDKPNESISHISPLMDTTNNLGTLGDTAINELSEINYTKTNLLCSILGLQFSTALVSLMAPVSLESPINVCSKHSKQDTLKLQNDVKEIVYED